MTTPARGAILFYPYLSMKSEVEIDFGFAKIWNYANGSEANISDDAIRDQIATLMAPHRSRSGPIGDMGVFSCDEESVFDPEPLKPDILSRARECRLLLFLACVAYNNVRPSDSNAGHWSFTAENFSEIYQRFQVGSDLLAEYSGRIIQKSDMGLEISEYRVFRPSHVLTPIEFRYDSDLLSATLEMRARRPRAYQRILNSTERFLESYQNSDNMSQNSAILLQMSAFETLLSLPSSQQRKVFKDKIREFVDTPIDKAFVYSSERRAGPAKETGSRNVIWADRFYTLRNHIVHGKMPPNENYLFGFRSRMKQRHIDIALMFFVFLVTQQVEKSLRKQLFYNSFIGEGLTTLLLSQTGRVSYTIECLFAGFPAGANLKTVYLAFEQMSPHRYFTRWQIS